MANLILQFSIAYIVGRLTEPKPPRLTDLTGFKADYGGTLPLIFGPQVRDGEGTIIWATDVIETKHKHKPALDYLFGVVGALLPKRKSYTYSISFAVAGAGNPQRRVKRILMNSKVVFDAGASTALVFTKADGTHSLFDTLRVYQGTMTQTPDPTIEAHDGMGNVPAYLGTAYWVMENLQLESFGNSPPSQVETEWEEAEDCTLARITSYMVAASGINPTSVSTSGLRREVLGFVVDNASSVADAFTPLIQAYQFDLADAGGSLRAIPRGRYPKSTVTMDQTGSFEGDEEDVSDRIRWTRAEETKQPREVTLSFQDPARGLQPNTAIAHRSGGSAQSNISVNTGLTLVADDGQRAADEVMWEQWAGRQVGATSVNQARDDIQAGDVHAFQTPNGVDTYRVMRRSKGANNIIQLELRADRPLTFTDPLPGIPASLPVVDVVLPGELNDPIFIEPPSTLAMGQVWIALSASLPGGGHDPNFGGVVVWVATTNTDSAYRNAGASDGAAYMGALTANLAAYVGANPDAANTLQVDLTESGGILESVEAADAATGGVNLYYVDGEFLTAVDAAATGAYLYDADNLYRALFGTVAGLHLAGSEFAVLDDAIFRLSLPPEMVGVSLFFKFTQVGQALADVAAWPYTPTGTGYGGGADGVPTAPTGLAATGSVESIVNAWAANPDSDNVTGYQVWVAPGTGSAFGSAVLQQTTDSLGWTQPNLPPSTGYTVFLVATNVVGSSAPSAGVNVTTSSITSGPAFVTVTTSQALVAGNLVNIHSSSGAKARKADATAAGKEAHGYVLSAFALAASAKVFLGGVISGLSGLTPGADVYLDTTAGAVTMVAPSASGNIVQPVGVALTATTALFDRQASTELA